MRGTLLGRFLRRSARLLRPLRPVRKLHRRLERLERRQLTRLQLRQRSGNSRANGADGRKGHLPKRSCFQKSSHPGVKNSHNSQSINYIKQTCSHAPAWEHINHKSSFKPTDCNPWAFFVPNLVPIQIPIFVILSIAKDLDNRG